MNSFKQSPWCRIYRQEWNIMFSTQLVSVLWILLLTSSSEWSSPAFRLCDWRVPPASGASVISRNVSHRPRWASVGPAGRSLRTWRPSCTGRRTPDSHCSSSAALAASDGPACCSCTDAHRVWSLLRPVKKRGDKNPNNLGCTFVWR